MPMLMWSGGGDWLLMKWRIHSVWLMFWLFQSLQTGMAALARVSFGFTYGNAHRDHKLWHNKYTHHCVQLIVRCSASNSWVNHFVSPLHILLNYFFPPMLPLETLRYANQETKMHFKMYLKYRSSLLGKLTKLERRKCDIVVKNICSQ